MGKTLKGTESQFRAMTNLLTLGLIEDGLATESQEEVQRAMMFATTAVRQVIGKYSRSLEFEGGDVQKSDDGVCRATECTNGDWSDKCYKCGEGGHKR